MAKSKSDLEKENAFLRLQLSLINENIENILNLDDVDICKCIGHISFLSDSKDFDRELDFILKNDLEINYYEEIGRAHV